MKRIQAGRLNPEQAFGEYTAVKRTLRRQMTLIEFRIGLHRVRYMHTQKSGIGIREQLRQRLVGKTAEKEQKIPNLQEGAVIPVVKFTVTQDKTKAPPAYTEGSLIRAMENIHTVVDDPVFKKFLKDGDGIGTSATRAAIIDELKKKDFLAVSGKKLNATTLGLRLLSVLPDVVKNPVLTALFESKLKDVEAGKMTLEAFEQEQRAFVSKCVAEAAQKNIHITIEK